MSNERGTRIAPAMTRLTAILLVAWVVFVAYAGAFVLSNGEMLRNRYTDSWWHIAVADEYVRTGVFAKDPFIPGAPRFAQFGLMDWSAAWTSRLTGRGTEDTFVLFAAVNVLVFLVASFVAGWWLNRRVLEGCICSVSSFAAISKIGLMGLSMPYWPALSLLFVLMASLWGRGSYREAGLVGGVWRGVLLGVLFGLHPLPGLAGCAVAGVEVGADIMASCRRRDTLLVAVGKAVALAGAFVLTALPWLVHQLALRGVLTSVNSHINPGWAVVPSELGFMSAGLVAAIALFVSARRGEPTRRALAGVTVFGISLLVLCVPAVNGIVARTLSSAMAERLPFLFPVGMVTSLAVSSMAGAWMERERVSACSAIGGLFCAVVLLPGAWPGSTLQWYLLRTHDYDRHRYAYLNEMIGRTYSGKVVLSDPFTSLFVRGRAGAYVVTVPSGHASPAVDYKQRDGVVRAALRGGPGVLEGFAVEAAVVDKEKTSEFAGITWKQIVDAWTRNEWRVESETPEAVVLSRSGGGSR